MNLKIPDDIVDRAEAGAGDLLLALAIQLYADNRIDHADACRLAGASRADFNREIVTRGISIHLYPAIARHRRKAG